MGAEETSSRRRRDASTMYYDKMIDRYDGMNKDNVNWAALMATFHEADAPNRVQSVSSPVDQSASQYGQSCMRCDVGNNVIGPGAVREQPIPQSDRATRFHPRTIITLSATPHRRQDLSQVNARSKRPSQRDAEHTYFQLTATINI